MDEFLSSESINHQSVAAADRFKHDGREYRSTNKLLAKTTNEAIRRDR
jgi:hypothetical protein